MKLPLHFNRPCTGIFVFTLVAFLIAPGTPVLSQVKKGHLGFRTAPKGERLPENVKEKKKKPEHSLVANMAVSALDYQNHLKLSPEQVAALKKLKSDYYFELRDLTKKIETQKKEIYENFIDGKSLPEIKEQQTELFKLTWQHTEKMAQIRSKVNTILKPVQFKELVKKTALTPRYEKPKRKTRYRVK